MYQRKQPELRAWVCSENHRIARRPFVMPSLIRKALNKMQPLMEYYSSAAETIYSVFDSPSPEDVDGFHIYNAVLLVRGVQRLCPAH